MEDWSAYERAMLRRLNGTVATDDLIQMLLDFAGVLEEERRLAGAKLLSVVARRLNDLSHPH